MLLFLVPAFLLGMIIPLLLPVLMPVKVLVITGLIAISLLILSCFIPHRKSCFTLASVLLGFIWFSYQAQLQLSQELPKALENKPLLIKGQIVSLPVMKYQEWQFQFKIDQICDKTRCYSQVVTALLTWQNPPSSLILGSKWQLTAKLKRPHDLANPGSFDREAWLFQNNLGASGTVLFSTGPPSKASGWFYRLAGIRQYYDKALLKRLAALPFAGVIDALTVGNSAAITSQQWQVFRNTGTTHLIAISGLHIGMIALLFYALGGWLWRFDGRLCLYLPAQKAAACSGILGALLYTAFSGFSIPAERTLIMIIVWMLSLLLTRFSLASQRFMLGLGCILLLNPFAVMNWGFWLSFSAIAIIGYGMQGRLQVHSLWWRFGRVQWVATIGLLPLSLLLFQQNSLVGFLANLIAIPWVGWVSVPLALLGCILLPLWPQLAYYLLWLAEKTLEVLWPYLHYLANIHGNSWLLGLNSSWLIIPALIAALLFLAPLTFPARWLALLYFLPVVLVRPATVPKGAVKLTVLDVGQGLSVIVETTKHRLIYDTGIGYPDGYNMGDVVLKPFFYHQHLWHLDQMIISHQDSDHAGGAKAILNYYPGLPVLTSAPAYFAGYPRIGSCVAGQHWQWDGVNFQMLYPFPHQANADNDTSCVLMVEASGQKVLLPGDIERQAEARLLANNATQLAATVLIAPHHGSQTSSTPAFAAAVHPAITIFATGYFNHYHFPSAKVVARYQQLGSQLYNVAYTGAITILLMPNEAPKITTDRELYPHFWR